MKKKFYLAHFWVDSILWIFWVDSITTLTSFQSFVLTELYKSHRINLVELGIKFLLWITDTLEISIKFSKNSRFLFFHDVSAITDLSSIANIEKKCKMCFPFPPPQVEVFDTVFYSVLLSGYILPGSAASSCLEARLFCFWNFVIVAIANFWAHNNWVKRHLESVQNNFWLQ